MNARLIQSERQFIDEAGLPRRPWYRHLLYAPGYYTGYGVKTMPGVREAIEDKRYAEVEREVVRVAAALTRNRPARWAGRGTGAADPVSNPRS